MKYIMFQSEIQGMKRRIPIIFPNFINHIDVTKALKDLDGIKTSKVYSAGEVHVKVDKEHGNSTTIGISSKDGDAEIINMIDYFHGIEY